MKTIILILFLAFLIAALGTGGYWYFNQKATKMNPIIPEPKSMLVKTVTPKHTPIPKISISVTQALRSEADNLLQNYYGFYSACLAGHFAVTPIGKAPTNSPQVDCPYNQTGALTDQLALKLKPIVGYDPILCSQNTPSSFSYDTAKVVGSIAKTSVHELFAAPTLSARAKLGSGSAELGQTIDIAVELQSQSGQWQISSITCPK